MPLTALLLYISTFSLLMLSKCIIFHFFYSLSSLMCNTFFVISAIPKHLKNFFFYKNPLIFQKSSTTITHSNVRFVLISSAALQFICPLIWRGRCSVVQQRSRLTSLFDCNSGSVLLAETAS